MFVIRKFCLLIKLLLTSHQSLLEIQRFSKDQSSLELLIPSLLFCLREEVKLEYMDREFSDYEDIRALEKKKIIFFLLIYNFSDYMKLTCQYFQDVN